MSRAADALRKSSLLQEVPDDVVDRVADVAVRRVYSAGETIFVEGDASCAAYVVASGQVRIYRTALGGREQDLVRVGPGQAFNTVPQFLRDGKNHATAQAATRVEAYVIFRQDLHSTVSKSPRLALALLRHFAQRLDHLSDLVEDLSLRTVRGRLARFLLGHAQDGTVTRTWTQGEMANQLGTVRDVIGRTLRSLADEGLIRMDRHRIVLLDQEELEAAAER
jgi:CRP/FNR family transcriptional regulator